MFAATPEAAEAAEQEAAQEVANLAGLRDVRAAAAWLQARPQLGHEVFTRPPRGPDPRAASYMALMEACLAVLHGRDGLADEQAVYRPAIPFHFRIADALIRMRARVAEMSEPRPLGDFLPAVPPERRGERVVVRSAVASTFVAALELCRGAVVELDQREDFSTIAISLRRAGTDDAQVTLLRAG